MRNTVIIVLLLLPALLSAQGWKLRKDEDGIKVFTKPSNSGFDAFKAQMSVKTTVDEVEKLIRNVEGYDRIFPDMMEARVLKRIGDSTQIQYSRNDAPWPVSDRDGIYQMTFRKNAKTGAVTTHAHAVPDYLPEVDGVVRMKSTESYWRIIPKENGLVNIEYEVYADPGGSIPEWLANSTVVTFPMESFENLRELLLDD